MEEDFDLGGRLLRGLAAYGNPNFVNVYAAQKEQELKREQERKRQESMAALASDPDFIKAPPSKQYEALAKIEGMGDFALKGMMEQNDPLRKIQMESAQLGLQNQRAAAEKVPALANYFKNLESNQGVVPAQGMGPMQPVTTERQALLDLAAIDPNTYGSAAIKSLSSTESKPTFIPGVEGYEYKNGKAVPISGLPTSQGKGEPVPGLEIAPDAAPTKEDAKIVKTSLQAKKNLDELLKEYKDLVEKYGFEARGTKDAKLMEQKQAQISLQMKNLEELGALQEADRAILSDMIGSPVGGFFSQFNPYERATAKSSSLAQINDFEKYLDRRFNSTLSTRGYIKPEQAANNEWSIREK